MNNEKNEAAVVGTTNLKTHLTNDTTIREAIMQAVGTIVDLNNEGEEFLLLVTPDNVTIMSRDELNDAEKIKVIPVCQTTQLDEYIADLTADHLRGKLS